MRSISSLTKKGQLNALGPAIIALVIAAVFLVLGLIVIQSTLETDVISKANSRTVVNETVATVNQAGDYLGGSADPACSASIIRVINASTGLEVPSTNYSVTDCQIFQVGGGYHNNTPWNVTYSYTYGDQAYSQGNETIVGLGGFADFWEIIVLAIVITIVIGLLLSVFGGRARR